ncbi:hypothetical protein D3C73_1612630 [compost metagenome]
MDAPEDADSKLFYMAAVGFQIEEPWFEDEEQGEGLETSPGSTAERGLTPEE